MITILTEPLAVSGPGENEMEGSACAVNILGLVVAGSSSIERAKSDGDITRISSVDVQYRNILGLVGWTCTVVHGDAKRTAYVRQSPGAPPAPRVVPRKLTSGAPEEHPDPAVEPRRPGKPAAKAAGGGKEWLIKVGGKVLGPFSTADIKRNFKAEKIGWDTPVKKQGWPQFKELREIKEFYGMN